MSYLQRAFESDTFKEINELSAYGFQLYTIPDKV